MAFVATTLLTPILVTAFLLLGFAVSHALLWRTTAYNTAGFGTTLRATAYASGLALLVAWVPVVNLVASLYATTSPP